MANLAIKGHATRGKEVIEILEMLGGENTLEYDGSYTRCSYVLDNTLICSIYGHPHLYTLEEFLKKFPYKIGDEVSVCGYETKVHIDDMKWDGFEIQYSVFTNETEWYSAEELNKFNKPYKEENLTIQDIRDKNAEWLLNKLREMTSENARQTLNDLYDELNKPTYPKTYKECCDVLGLNTTDNDVQGYKADLIIRFQELLIARDAYWKIIGGQMGLKGPWKPDWLNVEQDKFVLYTHDDVICSNVYVLGHNILAFPTKEILDAFYKNFKDLIERCKELL